MRKKVVAALIAAVIVGTGTPTFAATNSFKDVPSTHWAYDAVQNLAEQGILGEYYGDGTFRGNKNITRVEMAQMASALLQKLSPNSESIAKGIEEEWSKDGTKLSTRYEVATILAEVYTKVHKGNPPTASQSFKDIPDDHWAKKAVDLMAVEKIMEGYGDNTFKGERTITRYEAALLINKMYGRLSQ